MLQLERPDSATNTWINYTGLCCMIIGFILCFQNHIKVLYLVFISMCSYAVPILLLEVLILQSTKKISSGEKTPIKINIKRILTKLLALYFTLMILILCYWLFPEYHKLKYQEYWLFFEYTVVAIILTAPLYFTYVDSLSKNPFDAYWLLGRFLCFKFNDQNILSKNRRRLLSQHFLSWAVKGYFMPVMFVFLAGNIEAMYGAYKTNFLGNININTFFNVAIIILFSIDLLIALVGYVFTLKLFDSHVRSTDATCFGWVVCILCYNPFYYSILALYLLNMGSINSWMMWITNDYVLSIWYFIVLSLLAIYVMATIAFGIRFSNLTNRGIITHGPYRFTKHPAYITKNLFWWFATVPFSLLTTDPFLSIKSILSLLGINLIYYFRAKTEEEHLSNDPIYVQYALWMNENGLLAPLAKKIPFLRYRQPNN